MTQSSLPLSGILVADFTRILAGPLCTMLLGDAGARVIKIEERGSGDETRRWGPPFAGEESAYFLSVNRNKESLTLDLKKEEGREIARRLVAGADVVIDNFRPEQRRNFGLDEESVRLLNPRAVRCSIAGFESDGPDAGLPGFDLLAQAAGGLMSITGDKSGDPMKVGVALSDVLTAHYAHGAIVTALAGRERGGSGASLEISLVGSTVASLVNVAQSFLLTSERPRRYGNEHPSIVPYQTFHASDRSFALAATSPRQWELLCRRVIAREDLAEDERYRDNASRVANRESLIGELEQIFSGRPAADWVARCREAGVPAAAVETLDEIFRSNPSLASPVDHPSIGPYEAVINPVKWNGERRAIGSAPPRLGQHTSAILAELGWTADEVEWLKRAEVI